jgi:ring-1,2-phenylacetyl-CoA epoxidase subunit PaaD
VVIAADEIRRVTGEIPDPELPALTIEDLGILRDVRIDALGAVVVDITPTYSGCPALEVIREDVERSVRAQGYSDVTVRVVLSPAWTTDWMTDEGRRKLLEYGIAPPRERGADLQLLQLAVACPTCGSTHTSEVSHFGSTQCQAVRTCAGCRETFPHFKEH